MNTDFLKILTEKHLSYLECATKLEVINFFKKLVGVLFPDYSQKRYLERGQIEKELLGLKLELITLLCKDVTRTADGKTAKEVVDAFFDSLPVIYDLLLMDIKAIFLGDPAAKSEAEVIRTYPGFYAVVAYRIAHALEKMKVGIIPRLITEFAHSQTGIDIHPGATIGKFFCIDHGTGVVIGETTIIHDYVKIYQGVTLGALSVDKSDANMKRHPTIESHVVIYAGATILGGETVIGEGSVIGGNVWLTKSVKPNSKVYYKAQMHDVTEDSIDLFIYKTTGL